MAALKGNGDGGNRRKKRHVRRTARRFLRRLQFCSLGELLPSKCGTLPDFPGSYLSLIMALLLASKFGNDYNTGSQLTVPSTGPSTRASS